MRPRVRVAQMLAQRPTSHTSSWSVNEAVRLGRKLVEPFFKEMPRFIVPQVARPKTGQGGKGGAGPCLSGSGRPCRQPHPWLPSWRTRRQCTASSATSVSMVRAILTAMSQNWRPVYGPGDTSAEELQAIHADMASLVQRNLRTRRLAVRCGG
jgi:hypothetical protein